MSQAKLIGTAKAAVILGVSQSTVQRMANRGDLGPVEETEFGNGYFLLRLAAVEKAAKARTAKLETKAVS